MLASVPNTSKSVECEYPPLDSWVETSSGYFHTSTGLRSHKLPKGAVVLDMREHLTPESHHRSKEIFIEDVRKIRHDKREGWALTLNDDRRIKMEQPRLRSNANGRWYRVTKTGIDSFKWMDEH